MKFKRKNPILFCSLFFVLSSFTGCQSQSATEPSVTIPTPPTTTTTDALPEPDPTPSPPPEVETPPETEADLTVDVVTSASPAVISESNIQWSEKQILAVAQLGFDYQQTDFTQEIQACLEEYFPDSHMEEIPEYIFDGTETFFVIPRYPEKDLFLYHLIFQETDLEKGDLFTEIVGIPAFLFRGNVSDLMPNNLFEFEFLEETASFSISTSLKDGSISESPHILEIFLP